MAVEQAAPEPAKVGNGTWWQRLLRGARRICARRDWADYVGDDWADRIMGSEVTDDFHAKQGRSTGRWVLEAPGKQLSIYLKRHYCHPRLAGLCAILWPSGDWSAGMTERRNLEWAISQGIPVPRVVAAGEFMGPWGDLKSFLAIEELKDMLALHQAVPLAARQLDPVMFRTWKAGLTREMARLARMLHDRDRFHKDLYLCHFFIARADTTRVPAWANRVFMIDFHRLAHHALFHGFWTSKDLGQLWYSSLVEGVDARDRLRFWRAYLGRDRHTLWGRILRRIVLMRGRNYSRHNEKMAAKVIGETE